MKLKINNTEWEIGEKSNVDINIMFESDKKGTFTHGITQYSDNKIYINEESGNKKRTLIHELVHCFMYEYGHNQDNKKYNNEDVCEICACSYDFIQNIITKYFKEEK